MITGNFKTRRIWIRGEELSPVQSQKVYNHSPDGFNWGYGGSGPAQLALAILLEFTIVGKATDCYQKFKWDIIASLPKGDFSMPISMIEKWLKEKCF